MISQHPTYQAANPGLARLTVWFWMTALTGTRWLRDPNAPPVPLRDKLWTIFGAWAVFGLPALLVFWLGLWVIWVFVRLVLAALAVVSFVLLVLVTVVRAMNGRSAHPA